mmetsp:Transcript_28079/g.68273  ORF Transcript_28079/g.68273 Transcript_28079/m.68273 type:complete len:321 (-) Transcript_28079:753-1715(-)
MAAVLFDDGKLSRALAAHSSTLSTLFARWMSSRKKFNSGLRPKPFISSIIAFQSGFSPLSRYVLSRNDQLRDWASPFADISRRMSRATLVVAPPLIADTNIGYRILLRCSATAAPSPSSSMSLSSPAMWKTVANRRILSATWARSQSHSAFSPAGTDFPTPAIIRSTSSISRASMKAWIRDSSSTMSCPRISVATSSTPCMPRISRYWSATAFTKASSSSTPLRRSAPAETPSSPASNLARFLSSCLSCPTATRSRFCSVWRGGATAFGKPVPPETIRSSSPFADRRSPCATSVSSRAVAVASSGSNPPSTRSSKSATRT